MKKKNRRSAKQIMTKEARILRFMRESRGLSMRKAGKICGLSATTINHIDNGRKEITDILIFKLIAGYGYSYDDFLDFLEGRNRLPYDLLKDCVCLLNKLSPDKLRAVYGVLKTF